MADVYCMCPGCPSCCVYGGWKSHEGGPCWQNPAKGQLKLLAHGYIGRGDLRCLKCEISCKVESQDAGCVAPADLGRRTASSLAPTALQSACVHGERMVHVHLRSPQTSPSAACHAHFDQQQLALTCDSQPFVSVVNDIHRSASCAIGSSVANNGEPPLDEVGIPLSSKRVGVEAEQTGLCIVRDRECMDMLVRRLEILGERLDGFDAMEIKQHLQLLNERQLEIEKTLMERVDVLEGRLSVLEGFDVKDLLHGLNSEMVQLKVAIHDIQTRRNVQGAWWEARYSKNHRKS